MGNTTSISRHHSKRVSAAQEAKEDSKYDAPRHDHPEEHLPTEGKISPKSAKYHRITKQAGEVFGLGETPLLLRDNKKGVEKPLSKQAEKEAAIRAATVGVKYKTSAKHLIPTLFRWRTPPPIRRATVSGDTHKRKTVPIEPYWRPREVMVGGSFNDWQLIKMKPTKASFITIIELPVGEHQYKFNVDGVWVHHPFEPTVNDGVGGFNNVIRVTEADAEVFRALDVDAEEMERKRNRRKRFQIQVNKEYSQQVPYTNRQDFEDFIRQGGPPPVLPPHLLNVILNKDTPLCCEPTLLPSPNHVMVNHMYALSIKDNVIVLSATQRFKTKCVTTILYRPIQEQSEPL